MRLVRRRAYNVWAGLHMLNDRLEMQPVFCTTTSTVWRLMSQNLLINHIRSFVTKQGRNYLRHSASCRLRIGHSRKHTSAFTAVPRTCSRKGNRALKYLINSSLWSSELIQKFVRFTSSESATNTATAGPPYSATLPQLTVVRFDAQGNCSVRSVKKAELLSEFSLQPRDLRVSALSSLYVRQSSIILKLQHIKAIINADSVVLMDTDHPVIQELVNDLKGRLKTTEMLPYEFIALEAMLTSMFRGLDAELNHLEPSLVEVLDNLLDPQLFSVDRTQLHILLLQSKRLSEFHTLVKDVEATLSDRLDYEEDMADMYLTHYSRTHEDRPIDDIEEVSNILEAFQMQAEDLLSRIDQLKELMEQSENIININLDSQRNIMLRISLQLEMGMFSVTVCGLVGVAFGMNLDSSLENNVYAFWVVTGLMMASAGLLWRRLLMFLGNRTTFKRLTSKGKDDYSISRKL